MCVPPGKYYVRYVVPPIGIVASSANVGNDENRDSDMTGANGKNTTSSFTLVSGGEKCDVGAGFHPQSTIGDRVWYDSNENGVQDMNEAGASSVQVRVFNSDGEVISETITDEEGYYMVEELITDEYFIQIVPPLGYAITTAHMTDDELDSDIDHSMGLNTSSMISLEIGEQKMNIDAGLVFSSILSVENINLKVQRADDVNVLNWIVESDPTATHYTVERRLGSTNQFEQIGDVLSTQSTSMAMYTYTDYNAQEAGEYYYRVKQFRDTEEIGGSQIVYIQVTSETQIDVTVYPNPVVDKVNVVFSNLQDFGTIQMSDANGKIVMPSKKVYQIGQTKEIVETLDLREYARGVYYLTVTSEGSTKTIKLVLVD